MITVEDIMLGAIIPLELIVLSLILVCIYFNIKYIIYYKYQFPKGIEKGILSMIKLYIDFLLIAGVIFLFVKYSLYSVIDFIKTTDSIFIWATIVYCYAMLVFISVFPFIRYEIMSFNDNTFFK